MSLLERRFLYDTGSSRPRAEVLLLASDFLMIAAPTLLATGMIHRPGAWSDTALLLTWLAIPRAIARILAWVERPREPARIYFISFAFVICATALILAGWELIYAASRRHMPVGYGTAGVTLLAWMSGLFLFQPRAYRLYDFLCGAVALLGLLEKKPDPWLWIPLFFLGLTLSATTRHLLHDVFRTARRARLNLQNVRVLSLLATTVATVLFFGAYFLAHGGFDFPRQEDFARQPVRSWYPTELIAHAPALDGPGVGLSGTGRQAGRFPAGEPESFSYRMRIDTVASNPLDRTVAWVIRAADGGDSSSAWPPPTGSLWRGATFSRFDPESSSWIESRPLVRGRWPTDATLELGPGSTPRLDGEAPLVRLEYLVRVPVFRSLVSLERPERFTSKEISSFRANDAGDIFPEPRVEGGTRYSGVTRLLSANRLPSRPVTGSHPDRATYLELPPGAALGIDLRSLSTTVFGGSGASIQAKIEALRGYLRSRGFSYSRLRFWEGAGRAYARFLETTRIGNCTHYATTATLLLRATGVSTRLAVGFLGRTWDPERREAYLEMSMAHAWCEVYFPGTGWLPIDPTAWIDPHPENVSPPGNGAGPSSPEGGPGAPGSDIGFTDPPRSDLDGLERSSPGIGGAARLDRNGDPAPPRRGPSPARADRDTLAKDDDGSRYGDLMEFGWSSTRQPDPAASPDSGASGEPVPAVYRYAPEDIRLESYRDQATRRAGGDRADMTYAPTTLGQALRWVLVILGVLSGVLLVVTYRMTRRREDEEDEAEDIAEDDPLGLGPHDADLQEDAVAGDPVRSRIVRSYQRLQSELARSRQHRRPHQTPREHADMVLEREPSLERPFTRVVETLYRALFGTDALEPADAERQERACRSIRKSLR